MPAHSFLLFRIDCPPSSLRCFRVPRVVQYCVLLGIILLQAACVSGAKALRTRTLPTVSALHRTEHFDIRYSPASRTAAHVRWLGAESEAQLARICERLAVANDRRFELMVFDGLDEVAAALGDERMGGLAWEGTAYVTVEDSDARMHELIHLVVDAKIGRGKTRLLSEGIAVAMMDETSYRDHHAATQRYLAQNRLPPLSALVAMNPSAPDLSFDLYAVAGSWLRFLSDSYGVAKLKRYYIGESFEAVYGISLTTADRVWRDSLQHHTVTPAVADYIALIDGHSPWHLLQVEGFGIGMDWKPAMDRAVAAPDSFTCVWRKDGIVMPGPTNDRPTLRLFDLTPADSGVYSLTVVEKSAAGDRPPVTGLVVVLKVVSRADLEPSERKIESFAIEYQ